MCSKVTEYLLDLIEKAEDPDLLRNILVETSNCEGCSYEASDEGQGHAMCLLHQLEFRNRLAFLFQSGVENRKDTKGLP